MRPFVSQVGVQMALQLAFYRDQGTFTATYESAQMMSFHRGRTENIRTLSDESVAFVHAMSDRVRDNKKCTDALSRAVKVHQDYTKQAVGGHAIDRHLLGLRILASQNKLQPALFADEGESDILVVFLLLSLYLKTMIG